MLSKFEDFDFSLVERGELIVFLLLNTSALPWTKNGIGNYILAAHRGNLAIRRRPLDTQHDDDACAGTSGASSTPRRRVSNLPSFARPPEPTETPRGRRPAQQSRKRPSLSPVPEHDQEDQPTQLYTRAAPDKCLTAFYIC